MLEDTKQLLTAQVWMGAVLWMIHSSQWGLQHHPQSPWFWWVLISLSGSPREASLIPPQPPSSFTHWEPPPGFTRISILDQGSISELLSSHEVLQLPRTGIFKKGKKTL